MAIRFLELRREKDYTTRCSVDLNLKNCVRNRNQVYHRTKYPKQHNQIPQADRCIDLEEPRLISQHHPSSLAGSCTVRTNSSAGISCLQVLTDRIRARRIPNSKMENASHRNDCPVQVEFRILMNSIECAIFTLISKCYQINTVISSGE